MTHTSRRQLYNSLRLCFAAGTAMMLAACGHRASSDPTQVAARVGSYEITIFQVNNAASRLPSASKDPAAAKKIALESLINQQLAVEQAEKEKLDRSPDVLAAIDQARQQIIANAYLEQVAHNQSDPTEQDIQQYFDAHPELFSRRKSYSLKEITAPFSPEAVQFLKAHTDITVDQFAQWLQSKNVPFTPNTAVRSSESLPISLLPQLVNVKDGGTAFTQNGSTIYVVQVLGTKAEPVSETQAAPAIKKFMQTQRAREAVDKELTRLKQITKVAYEGDFAKASSLGAPSETLTH